MNSDELDEIKRHLDAIAGSVRTQIQESRQDLQTKILESRQELQARILDSRQNLQNQIQEARQELQTQILETRVDLQAQIQDNRRHFGVLADGLETHVKLVAEAVTAVDEKIERRFEDVGRRFDETRDLVKSSITRQDRRVESLEHRVEKLEQA